MNNNIDILTRQYSFINADFTKCKKEANNNF